MTDNVDEAKEPVEEVASGEDEDKKVDHTAGGSMPNPMSLLKGGNKAPLPEVEQLGKISLETLNQYHCNNPDRRLLSLCGEVYDVTPALNKYGPDGAYKEFAGHDMTLAIGAGQLDAKWLDMFIKMTPEWKSGAENWIDFYASKYPKCGRLDKWDEDPETWREPSPEEVEELNKSCVIL